MVLPTRPNNLSIKRREKASRTPIGRHRNMISTRRFEPPSAAKTDGVETVVDSPRPKLQDRRMDFRLRLSGFRPQRLHLCTGSQSQRTMSLTELAGRVRAWCSPRLSATSPCIRPSGDCSALGTISETVETLFPGGAVARTSVTADRAVRHCEMVRDCDYVSNQPSNPELRSQAAWLPSSHRS